MRQRSSKRGSQAGWADVYKPLPQQVKPSAPAMIPRAFSEAAEPDVLDSANDALNRIERDVRQVLGAGGEYALRNRLDRLLATHAVNL